MKRIQSRSLGLVTAVLALTLTTAACGTTEESGSAGSDREETSASAETTEAAASSGPFGAACDQVPTEGPGSVEGMSEAPVATAAGNNPLLTTLADAVGAAGLVETLNSAPEITVFAPANPAFEQIPSADLEALLADKPKLTGVLTHHVVEGRLAPEDVAGTHTTLNGDEITVEGSGEELTVGTEDANIVCGNVSTANATVYVIDGVLMPQSM